MRPPLGAQLTRSTESGCLPKDATWGAEAGQGRGVDASMHGGMQCRAQLQRTQEGVGKAGVDGARMGPAASGLGGLAPPTAATRPRCCRRRHWP